MVIPLWRAAAVTIRRRRKAATEPRDGHRSRSAGQPTGETFWFSDFSQPEEPARDTLDTVDVRKAFGGIGSVGSPGKRTYED
jgi:hypothetical protein